MIKIICYALGTAFPDVTVNREKMNQREKPFFAVRAINTSQAGKIGNFYVRETAFEIKYFPKDGVNSQALTEQLTEVANNLYECLEYMEFKGEKMRSYDMKHRIEDNVLQFFITCRQNLKRPDDVPFMEELETAIGKKG